MLKIALSCALIFSASMSYAGESSTIPQPGVENIASHDLETGKAWWADDGEGVPGLPEPDPLEPLNRVFFNFNRVMDGILLKPAAIIYDDTLPQSAKKGVGNFIDNIFAPVTFANNVLQGDIERAGQTFFRFLINSTIGFFGIMDPAKEMGLPGYQATLNQTFATWGVETGPYVMVPFLGPSSFRGVYGMLGDWAMNPLYYIAHNKHRQGNKHRQQMYLLYTLYGLDMINRRAKLIDALNDIEKNSLDPYVTIRTIFFQKQAEMEKEIKERKQEKS